MSAEQTIPRLRKDGISNSDRNTGVDIVSDGPTLVQEQPTHHARVTDPKLFAWNYRSFGLGGWCAATKRPCHAGHVLVHTVGVLQTFFRRNRYRRMAWDSQCLTR